MIQRIVNRIVDIQIKNQSIQQEDINIYKYGYFLLLEVIINLIISFTIALFFDDIKTLLFFLLFYIPIRTYSGGWHANEMWKCTFISNIILVVAESISNFFIDYIPVGYCVFFMILLGIYILAVSPVDTEYKPLEKAEKIIYGKKLKIIFIIHLMILILFLIFYEKKGIIIFEYVYEVQAIMLTIEIIKSKYKIKKKKNIN